MSVLRKILTGIVALAVVFGVYWLYSRFTKTPPIKLPGAAGIDANVPDFNGPGGEIIPGTSVPHLVGPTYITRDPVTKQVDREFGFKELIRTVGDVWEVEKPWMKVYQKDLECHVTADKGTTELETVVDSPTPKDATFSGNVVIRIIPTGPGAGPESTIYLDNLVFQSDKSQFSTAGPVKFVSPEAQMNGTGLLFVYNDLAGRLDYLRLTHLESLRIRTTESALRSGLARPGEQAGATAAPPARPAAAVDAPTGERATTKDGAPDRAARAENRPAQARPPDPNQAQRYKCILSKNVLIASPQHLIFAYEEVSINELLWSGSPSPKGTTPDAAAPLASLPPGSGPPRPCPSPPAALEPADEPNESPEKTVEILVTCDNGVLLVPMDSPKTLKDFASADTPRQLPEALENPRGRATFRTERIDYDAVSGDATASGATQVVFWNRDLGRTDANDANTPVTVTASRGATFNKAANQVVFHGRCRCTTAQQGLAQQRDIQLLASQFTVNLPAEANDPNAAPEIIAAGPVELTLYVQDANAADANQPPLPAVVTAQDRATFIPEANQVIFDGNCLCTIPQPGMPAGYDYTLSSPRLIANLPASRPGIPQVPDINALGPVELDFFVDAFTDPNKQSEPLPGQVTARKNAHFLPARNKVIFQGDCRASVTRTEPNYLEQFILTSGKIVVELPADSNDDSASQPAAIERISAFEGVVTLANIRTVGQKQIAGAQLKCRKFEYDPNQEIYTATGPGVITLKNTESSAAAEPNDASARFSLKNPCWAFVENFDTLSYFLKEGKIVAEAEAQALVVKYLPLRDGRLDEVHVVTASRVVANLAENDLGQTELKSLTASGGVTYQGRDNQFQGGTLTYDHLRQIMEITASETFPCQFNGALTDRIEYDVKNDAVKAEIVAPGTIPR